MAYNIKERLRSKNIIHVDIRINDPFLRLRNIFRQLPPIWTEHS